ncbi:MAG: hypothetical protein ABIQ95_08255 [Bdellovibrionia bacterium]
MLSEKVKERIEDYSKVMLKSNPFAIAAREGRLTEKNVVVYLTNLMWIFKQHSYKIEHASKRAKAMGLNQISDFMADKYVEELDHYQWPQEDLKSLGVTANIARPEGITSSAVQMISFLDELIERNPSLFIVYMALLEYFTVLAAPEFLQNIEKKCGIPASHFTAISKHVVADEKHVLEGFQMIGAFASSRENAIDVLATLEQSIVLVDDFFRECAVVQ